MQTETGWPYKAVFAVLQNLNPDMPAHTLNHRIKSWQKLGVPQGTNVGRGVRAQYTASALLHVCLFNELSRMGFTPVIAKAMLEDRDLLAEWDGSDYVFRPDPLSDSNVTVSALRIIKARDAYLSTLTACERKEAAEMMRHRIRYVRVGKALLPANGKSFQLHRELSHGG